MDKESILRALDGVEHPETGLGLAAGGFVNKIDVAAEEGRVSVVLKFRRQRDPFAPSLSQRAARALREAFPGVGVEVSVAATPSASAPVPAAPSAEKASTGTSRRLPGVRKIVAVASGKGGVGKSTVAAQLAVALAGEGYRVGILDGDIYGPSQPLLFGIEDYVPPVEGANAPRKVAEAMIPAEREGIKVMSIGFFIPPSDALVWRGPMATGALRQLIRQTAWGELDYLLVDLPPGTGDVHLSVAHEVALDGAIIVTTPGELAVADARRGIAMLRSEGIEVPVLGVVENMAWFTPAELPDNRYYIFGRGCGERFAEETGIELLAEIPIVQSVGDCGREGLPLLGVASQVADRYVALARRVVEKLG